MSSQKTEVIGLLLRRSLVVITGAAYTITAALYVPAIKHNIRYGN